MEFINGLNPYSLVDLLVTFAVVILFLWGGTNKFGKKDEFNEDFLSLDTMMSLRGFAAIGVMIHHVSQEWAYQEQGILSIFVNAGAYFVAIFFFCSGYGLIKSLDTKKDYLKGFVKKRIVRAIIVPFYVNVVIYGILMLLVKIPYPRERWIFNFLGLTMMNSYAWFPIVLAILYFVFFLCFRFIKNRPVCFGIILAVIIALGIGFCFNGHYGFWYGPHDNWWMEEGAENYAQWWQNENTLWFSGEWWINSAPAFLAGLIFANYEKKIVSFFKKNYAKKFAILVAITLVLFVVSKFGQARFGYWTEFNGTGLGIKDKIITLFMQMPVLTVIAFTVFVFMMKYHVSNPVSRFFGEYSLHTYLMNLSAITVFRFMEFEESPIKLGKFNLLVYLVCVLLLSTALGVLEQRITESVQRKLFEKKLKPEPMRSLLSDDGENAIDKRMSLSYKSAASGKSSEAPVEPAKVSTDAGKS